MPLQSPDFMVLGLAIQGDAPPDSLQPPLADGIHLRWSFLPALGFPWYGVYVWRREHGTVESACIGPELKGPPRTLPDPRFWQPGARVLH